MLESAIQNGWAVKCAPKAEPSQILRPCSRWAPNSLPEPCFRRERDLGGETSGRQKAEKESSYWFVPYPPIDPGTV